MRTRVLLAATIATLLLGTHQQAEAQITYDGCADYRGYPVVSQATNQITDVAIARVVNGQPVIYYNPRVLSWFQPQTRLWWYGHECGHHALAHLARGNYLTAEQEADCYAVNTLVASGYLTMRDVAVVQRDLARIGPGDWTHLPGPVRAINLEACLRAVGGGADTQSVELVFPPWSDGGAVEMDVVIDGDYVGSLDNAYSADYVDAGHLAPGVHSFRFEDIAITAPNGRLFNVGGVCAGRFRVSPGQESYRVTLVGDNTGPRLLYRCGIE